MCICENVCIHTYVCTYIYIYICFGAVLAALERFLQLCVILSISIRFARRKAEIPQGPDVEKLLCYGIVGVLVGVPRVS